MQDDDTPLAARVKAQWIGPLTHVLPDTLHVAWCREQTVCKVRAPTIVLTKGFCRPAAKWLKLPLRAINRPWKICLLRSQKTFSIKQVPSSFFCQCKKGYISRERQPTRRIDSKKDAKGLMLPCIVVPAVPWQSQPSHSFGSRPSIDRGPHGLKAEALQNPYSPTVTQNLNVAHQWFFGFSYGQVFKCRLQDKRDFQFVALGVRSRLTVRNLRTAAPMAFCGGTGGETPLRQEAGWTAALAM